jgi:hypothetical protein
VLWVLGRRDEAIRYFEEARRLDADSRALARALEKTGARLPPVPAASGSAAPSGAAPQAPGTPAP